MPASQASRRPKPALLLLLLLLTGSSPGLRAAVDGTAYPKMDPKQGMKPLEALAWDASFMVTPSSAHDPLQPVGIDYVQPYATPEEQAQHVPAQFQEDRGNGRIPFIFIEANIKPRFRRDLVPVMLVGPLGLFTDRAVPEFIQRGVEQCIRNKAAQMPGGAFKLNGEPVELGGREQLIRHLEEMDRRRDEDNAITRALNKRKYSADERQARVLTELLNTGLSRELDDRNTNFNEYRPSPLMGPEKYFEDVKKYGARIVAKGQIPIIYAPADTPKNALADFPPIARIGAWGLWGSPDSPAADLALLERAFATLMKNEDFREAAYLLAVDDFGGPADLRQLVAQTAERAPLAKAAAAPAPPAVAPPPRNGGDRHGPPLGPPAGGLAPGMHDDGRKDPPIPPAIHSATGGPQGWLPLSEEEKARHAKEQADFAKQMAAKQRKIEDLKKQRAKEDTERFNNNLKILKEWCRQKQEEQDALNKRMIEKLRAAENQPGAVTPVIKEWAGDPQIFWTNHTDVVLYVEFTYTGTIDGVSVGELQGSTLVMSGTGYVGQVVEPFFGLNGKKGILQILSVRWWAREQDNAWRH